MGSDRSLRSRRSTVKQLITRVLRESLSKGVAVVAAFEADEVFLCPKIVGRAFAAHDPIFTTVLLQPILNHAHRATGTKTCNKPERRPLSGGGESFTYNVLQQKTRRLAPGSRKSR